MPDTGNGKSNLLGAGSPCPICRKPAVVEARPFCSKRCANVDLHRWLSGAYAIPVTEDSDEDGERAEVPQAGRKTEEN
jgi:endogenous inhibitor of DNA gyrase (YacG/DUF329 family)